MMIGRLTERGYELDGVLVEDRGFDDVPAAPVESSLPGWFAQAACRDDGPDFFFPTSANHQHEIVAFCEQCPVRLECGEYALEERIEHGWWGGLSENERRRILRRRRNGRWAS